MCSDHMGYSVIANTTNELSNIIWSETEETLTISDRYQEHVLYRFETRENIQLIYRYKSLSNWIYKERKWSGLWVNG